MKTLLILCLLALAGGARAAVPAVYSVNNLSTIVPDNNVNGIQNSLVVNGLLSPIANIAVTLNMSGGFNGDLYGYLSHNGNIAVLLNRVGVNGSSAVGYPDHGFSTSFVFNNQAASDVHFYRLVPYILDGGGALTGAWQPDGRLVDPLSSGSAIAAAPRGNTLSVFDSMDPNGTWTLFLADLSGGGQSTLLGWGLQITPVPEPSSVALLGLSLVGGFFLRRRNRSAGC